MANYTITPNATSETSITKTLTGTTADLVTIDTPSGVGGGFLVNITNWGTTRLGYRRDYTTAVLNADGCNPIAANGGFVEFRIRRRPGGTKLSIVASGNEYTVTVVPQSAVAS